MYFAYLSVTSDSQRVLSTRSLHFALCSDSLAVLYHDERANDLKLSVQC